ncbi:hypothetical protein [Kitasatospora sp. NPDC091207]|uniref:hypothetical protein n=1 Tax=Kitasatospora sp. NPDC091207 TaxID=3364083 RepID=UPI0037FB5CE6
MSRRASSTGDTTTGRTLPALTALPGDTAAVITEPRDRAESADAVYRFALGQDLKDRELLASAFAVDAEPAFRQVAAHWAGRRR